MPSAHSLYSASAAERWGNCPGAIALCYGAPPGKTSAAAAEGILCHSVSEECLRSDENSPEDYIGSTHHVHGFDIEFTDELAELCGVYVNYVRGIAGQRLIEVRSNYSATLGLPEAADEEDEEAFGTSDAVILNRDELHIVDAKFGRGYVSVLDSKQLSLYASGVLDSIEEFIGELEISKIYLHIVQPRISNKPAFIETDREGLRRVTDKLKHAVVLSKEALSCYDPDNPSSVLAYLHPSETACRWCPVKVACPALAMIAESVDVAYPVEKLKSEKLSEAMSKVELLELYTESVRAEVTRRCIDGQDVQGYKMVKGRKGNRKWRDENDAAIELTKNLGESDVYTRKLVSPAEAEKIVKKRKLDVNLEALVTRSSAKPVLATADDPREAWSEDRDIADEFD